jgi:hypothetical protein
MTRADSYGSVAGIHSSGPTVATSLIIAARDECPRARSPATGGSVTSGAASGLGALSPHRGSTKLATASLRVPMKVNLA